MNLKNIADDAISEGIESYAEDSGEKEIRKLRDLYRQRFISHDSMVSSLSMLYASGKISKAQFISGRSYR